MFPKIAVVSKAIASLFDSTCEVYTYKKTARKCRSHEKQILMAFFVANSLYEDIVPL